MGIHDFDIDDTQEVGPNLTPGPGLNPCIVKGKAVMTHPRILLGFRVASHHDSSKIETHRFA